MRASEYKSLTLDVPAASAGMWLVVNSSGVRAGSDYKVCGNGLWVSRSYKKLDGTEIDPSDGSLKLGDVVFVEDEVENKTGAAIQNIALVDRLPAGFEIENPRLGRATRPDWVKDEDLWAVDFLNMRADHLEAFGTLAASDTKKVVYSVRVGLPFPRAWRWAARRVLVANAALLVLLAAVFDVPLPDRTAGWSVVVEYRDGTPAYVFLAPDDKWRLPVDRVDPAYVRAHDRDRIDAVVRPE